MTLPITRQEGRLRWIELDGQTCLVSHLYCDCADAIIEAAPRPGLVIIHCPQHGDLQAVARSGVAWGMHYMEQSPFSGGTGGKS